MTKRTPGRDALQPRHVRGQGRRRGRRDVVDDDAAAEKSAAEARCASCGASSRRPATAPLRERLILHYSPLVKYVAGRVGVGLPPNIEQADLVSYGIFGLIDAIEKFDLERGHQVRDLRDQPHPRRDHRRAAGDRLDPALGALQGPRGREGLRLPRGPAAPHAHRGRGRRRDGHQARGPAPDLQPGLVRQRRRARRAAQRRRREGRQAQPRRHPRGHQGRGPGARPSRPRRPSTCSPGRSTRCPSGRRSS